MCAPAALGVVAGIAQAGVGFMASEADYQAKQQQYVQNIINSEAAARDEHKQILLQQLQEQDATTQRKHISQLDEAQKSSTAEVSAIQGGVEGNSVNNILADIAGKSELNRTYADENYQNVVAQTQAKLTGSDTTLKSRINSLAAPVAPSPLSLVAGIATAGIKGYDISTRRDSMALSGLSMGDS